MAYTPLIAVSDLTNKPFADAVKALSGAQQTELVTNASQAVEDFCRRRLAPFTGLVEHHRAEMVDVDSSLDYPPVLLDTSDQIGWLRAQSLNATSWVRAVQLDEYPPRWPDMWSGAISDITVVRDLAGSTDYPAAQLLEYEQDTGFVRFQLGAYIPPGSSIQVTYSGGYTTTPGTLKVATEFEAIEIGILSTLPELAEKYDLAWIRAKKVELLTEYVRRDDGL
jgi:hypothetical protein